MWKGKTLFRGIKGARPLTGQADEGATIDTRSYLRLSRLASPFSLLGFPLPKWTDIVLKWAEKRVLAHLSLHQLAGIRHYVRSCSQAYCRTVAA